MCGNYLKTTNKQKTTNNNKKTNKQQKAQRPENDGNSVEHDQNLLRPGEADALPTKL